MVNATAAGQSFAPPPPGEARAAAAAKAAAAVPAAARRAGAPGASSGRRGSWDDWGDEPAPAPAAGGPGAFGAAPARPASTTAAAKDAYFARVQAANAARPNGVAPSAGGKYVGFGSAPPPSTGGARRAGPSGDAVDDAVAALTRGVAALTSVAGDAAAAARDAAREAGVADVAADAARRGRAGAAKGWSMLRSAVAVAASKVEAVARDGGLDVDLGALKRVAPGAGARASAPQPSWATGSAGDADGWEPAPSHASPARAAGDGFAGFGGGAADDGWGAAPKAAPAAAASPRLTADASSGAEPGDDWGKW